MSTVINEIMARAELDKLIENEIERARQANLKKNSKWIDVSDTVYHVLNTKDNRELLRRVLGTELMKQWDESPHFRARLLRGIPVPTIQVDDINSMLQLSRDSPVLI